MCWNVLFAYYCIIYCLADSIKDDITSRYESEYLKFHTRYDTKIGSLLKYTYSHTEGQFLPTAMMGEALRLDTGKKYT